MILPIAPILEWAVIIEREKVLLWRKKKAKPEKEPPDPKKYLKEDENYVSPDLMATDKNEY